MKRSQRRFLFLILAVGLAFALSLLSIYFQQWNHSSEAFSEAVGQAPDEQSVNLLDSPRPSSTSQGATFFAQGESKQTVPRVWKETDNLALDPTCRSFEESKIDEIERRVRSLKRIASESHPLDSQLASGFSDFERSGIFYQFSLSLSGKQNESGEQLFQFLLTSAASSEISSPFKVERFEDERFRRAVTQAEGKSLWDSYIVGLRSDAAVRIAEVRYRSFLGSQGDEMFEVSNGNLVGFSGQNFGCVNEKLGSKLQCSCRATFAD